MELTFVLLYFSTMLHSCCGTCDRFHMCSVTHSKHTHTHKCFIETSFNYCTAITCQYCNETLTCVRQVTAKNLQYMPHDCLHYVPNSRNKGKQIGWGCSRVRCWWRYLGLTRRKWQKMGGNHTMRSFIISTHEIFFWLKIRKDTMGRVCSMYQREEK
jgi:hypothetical protein